MVDVMTKETDTLSNQAENNLEALFEAANRDSALKKKLLANPKEVAAEWRVTLSSDDVEQLNKLHAIVELADDVKYSRLYRKPRPIGYPIDVWKAKAMIDIFSDALPRERAISLGTLVNPGPIFYPAELLSKMEDKLLSKLRATARTQG